MNPLEELRGWRETLRSAHGHNHLLSLLVETVTVTACRQQGPLWNIMNFSLRCLRNFRNLGHFSWWVILPVLTLSPVKCSQGQIASELNALRQAAGKCLFRIHRRSSVGVVFVLLKGPHSRINMDWSRHVTWNQVLPHTSFATLSKPLTLQSLQETHRNVVIASVSSGRNWRSKYQELALLLNSFF